MAAKKPTASAKKWCVYWPASRSAAHPGIVSCFGSKAQADKKRAAHSSSSSLKVGQFSRQAIRNAEIDDMEYRAQLGGTRRKRASCRFGKVKSGSRKGRCRKAPRRT